MEHTFRLTRYNSFQNQVLWNFLITDRQITKFQLKNATSFDSSIIWWQVFADHCYYWNFDQRHNTDLHDRGRGRAHQKKSAPVHEWLGCLQKLNAKKLKIAAVEETLVQRQGFAGGAPPFYASSFSWMPMSCCGVETWAPGLGGGTCSPCR